MGLAWQGRGGGALRRGQGGGQPPATAPDRSPLRRPQPSPIVVQAEPSGASQPCISMSCRGKPCRGRARGGVPSGFHGEASWPSSRPSPLLPELLPLHPMDLWAQFVIHRMGPSVGGPKATRPAPAAPSLGVRSPTLATSATCQPSLGLQAVLGDETPGSHQQSPTQLPALCPHIPCHPPQAPVHTAGPDSPPSPSPCHLSRIHLPPPGATEQPRPGQTAAWRDLSRSRGPALQRPEAGHIQQTKALVTKAGYI